MSSEPDTRNAKKTRRKPEPIVWITIKQTSEKRRLRMGKKPRGGAPSSTSPGEAMPEDPGVFAPDLTPKDRALLSSLLAMPSKAWSLGSFGAIAEFLWSESEPSICRSAMSRVTPRGGIRIAPPAEVQIVQYTTPSVHAERRRRELALCLARDACSLNQRRVITEIGPDEDALRDEDRRSILFDIGLGRLQTDCYVRTSDPNTLRALRDAEGTSLFDPGHPLAAAMPSLSPHRVFVTRCGRIEVYQPIPSIDGRSPDGPHTHVLPKLLRTGRTHAANIPLPDGLVPCLTAHFSHPDPDHATSIDEGDAHVR